MPEWKEMVMKTAGRVLMALLLLVLAVWAFSYHSFEFKGGLGVSDTGFFSYPRYHAQLGEMPSWKNGEYQFTVRGLPPGPLDLVLQVPNTTDADRAALGSLSNSLSVEITDSSGNEVCEAIGSLSDPTTRERSAWAVASSTSDALLWQPRCQQLTISRFKTYTVRVIVSGADDRPPHRMLKPIFQGGGNELP
jgi:hypothetical protein